MLKHKASLVAQYVFLIFIAAISVFPFLFMVLGMTNSSMDIAAGRFAFGNQFITNVTSLYGSSIYTYAKALLNSGIIAVITTVLSLFICSLAGYGFEVYRSKWRDKLFNLLLISMMIPFAVQMIPLFRMFSALGNTPLSFIGLNTKGAIILPTIAGAFFLFFFRQNAKSFPRDLVEAARIDGVSEFGIFLRIFLPTNKNTFAAAAIITFMNSWNNFMWPLVALQTQNQFTFPLQLSAMGASYSLPDYGMIFVAVVSATIPMAIIFFLMQKQFVHGMLGSIK